MRAPDFWEKDGRLLPALLAPLAAGYAAAGRLRRAMIQPWKAPVPVICVGALTVGGAGKTPVALALGRHLGSQGRRVHFLTRGYGGREAGPLRVDPARHGARDVGDEALLLAHTAPCWVARDRPAGARAAATAGAQVIVMDDGFQNPSLAKNLALLVIDGGHGLGNGWVLPAGPLREPAGGALARADAVILIGEDRSGLHPILSSRPVLGARLLPGPEAQALAGRKLLAFAGLGRPEKFFASLRAIGADLAATVVFPDHHPYSAEEVERLCDQADRLHARPVTTAKDAVRLPPALRDRVQVATVHIEWADSAALDRLLASKTHPAGGSRGAP
jgi:tetraacyldisaccharide 4'-kinase